MAILPRPWKTLLLFGATGILSVSCWWQIRLLGDITSPSILGVFYGWFALAFLAYLAMLWLIHYAVERRDGPATGKSLNTIALAIIFISAVAFRLCLLGTTPTLSDDIYRYQWDGRVERAGIDPYVYPPNAPQLAFLRDEAFTHINFPHLRTVYPPLTELAFRLSVLLGSTLTAQKIVFVIAELLTVLSLLFILWKRGQSLLWVAAYAWHPLMILEVAGSGHNDALGVAMLWLGLAAWEARSWPGAAIGWVAAFLSKFLPIVLVPWWWCRKEGRGWLITFLTLAAIPLALHPRIVMNVIEGMAGVSALRTSSNGFVFPLLASLLGSAAVAKMVVIGAWATFLVWWGRREADAIRYLLGALTFAALASPALHPWYLLWMIPCFCFYRVPAILALTATVVLAYTMWPGYLADGSWTMPLWARVLEYAPVVMLGCWGMRRWMWGSSFRLAMKPARLAKS